MKNKISRPMPCASPESRDVVHQEINFHGNPFSCANHCHTNQCYFLTPPSTEINVMRAILRVSVAQSEIVAFVPTNITILKIPLKIEASALPSGTFSLPLPIS